MKNLGYWVSPKWLSALILGALSTSTVWASDDGWEQIDASDPFLDRNGVWREPSCSGGPVPTSDGLSQANTDFSFFVRRGDPEKLLIAFSGGGACWDPRTCLETAILGTPVYAQKVNETTDTLNDVRGLADMDNPANPVGDYTLVFIPYCTGDLHMGAKDTEYSLTTPEGTTVSWTIYHRGFDNVTAVFESLIDYYQNEVGYAPADVLLTGGSAGGYGVLYNYPVLRELLPRYTRIRVLSDSASGVINQDFYDRALAPEGVWGAWRNLAPELFQAFASGPDDFAVEINRNLGWNYPGTRFGQYTCAFDEVQVRYYNIARNLNSPELWADPVQLSIAELEWTAKTRAQMRLSALTTANYRFYLARGKDHTIIAGDSFYQEDSAEGVLFANWFDDMNNGRQFSGSDWRNVSCEPDCMPISP